MFISRSKDNIFRCMRNALDACPAAKKVLAFWGHQQTSLEEAVNLLCDELPRTLHKYFKKLNHYMFFP